MRDKLVERFDLTDALVNDLTFLIDRCTPWEYVKTHNNDNGKIDFFVVDQEVPVTHLVRVTYNLIAVGAGHQLNLWVNTLSYNGPIELQLEAGEEKTIAALMAEMHL
jgi:hypothetical protein